MTQVGNSMEARRQEWITRVNGLADQIRTWAVAEGWQVQQGSKTIQEPQLGEYQVPVLTIRLPGGELMINPIGLHIVRGGGRVDIEATPTLNRVKLIGSNGTWIVMTDSNVPLRMDWTAQRFAELARDLLA